jgi:hypothetical protein
MSLPRKTRSTRRYLCASLMIFLGSPAFLGGITKGQELPTLDQATIQGAPQSASQNTGTPRIQVLRVTEPIKIDGKLDEVVWSQAEIAGEFRQQEPNEGTPATEKTEVRVLFDEKNLYIGIHAFDVRLDRELRFRSAPIISTGRRFPSPAIAVRS